MSVAERLRRDPGLALLLAALLLAIAVYAPTLGTGLVNYDDPWLVRDNWLLQDPSWHALRAIAFDFSTDTRATLGAEYLPVRDLSVMLDFAVWGHWWQGFHLTNLVVYLASIALWFGALAGFGIDRRVAGLAVLLWALHPAHAESVAWIAERKGLLAAMFAGAAALGYARFRAGGRAAWLALAAVTAVAAVWSKAPAAFALAALAGLEWVLPARRASLRRALVGLGVIAVVAAAAFVPIVMVAVDLSVVAPDAAAVAGGGRVTSALGTFGFYLRLGAMTLPNAVSYELATAGPSVLDLVLGAAGLAATLAVVVAGRSPALRAAGVIWLAGWFPVSRLVLPLQVVVVADRYLLFPSLGLALAAAAGVCAIPRRRAATALAGVLVLAAGLRALDAQGNWRDDLTLWARAARSNPGDAVAVSRHVEALAAAGQEGRALAIATAAVERMPVPRLQHQLGLLLIETDRPRAVALVRAAADGGLPHAMTNLAVLLRDAGRLEEALPYARRAVAQMPRYAHGHRVLGKLALAAGRADEALAAFQQALAIEPACPNAVEVAGALIALGRRAEAAPYLERCAGDPRAGARARALRAMP